MSAIVFTFHWIFVATNCLTEQTKWHEQINTVYPILPLLPCCLLSFHDDIIYNWIKPAQHLLTIINIAGKWRCYCHYPAYQVFTQSCAHVISVQDQSQSTSASLNLEKKIRISIKYITCFPLMLWGDIENIENSNFTIEV